MKNSLAFCFFLVTTFCIAQTNSSLDNLPPVDCGFDQMQARAFQNPQIQQKSQQFEEAYQKIAQSPNTKSNETLYKIPTVIHIIHNNREIGMSVHNPTDERAAATITWVNKQLRNTSSPDHEWESPFAGVDSNIELCLASIDPQGNPTTGINRYNLPAEAVDPTDAIDSYNWDVSRYFNIFVVEEVTWAGGYYCPHADHIVVESIRNSFSFPLVTHEVGHYFSLLHTFAGCPNSNCLTTGDMVCDTPPSAIQSPDCENPENTCQTDDDDTNSRNPYRPTNLGGLGDQPDFAGNFMAYSNCFPRFFSEGQKVRMRANIETMRMNMVTNSATLCNTCQDDLTLNETHTATQSFQAKNTITSQSVINVGVTVDYQAGQSITLQPEFHAKEGAIFSATILANPCANTLIPTTTETSTLKQTISEQPIIEQTVNKVNINVYPNPFTTSTDIQFTLPTATAIQLQLYDLNGQLVQTITPKSVFETGNHSVHWENNRNLAGMYFLQLTSSEERVVKKVLLLN